MFGQESLIKLLEDDFGAQTRLKLLTKLPGVFIDVSVCFVGGSEEGKHLLDFILQSDTAILPKEVNDQVLDVLRAAGQSHQNN